MAVTPQERYHNKQSNKGLVRVTVWVHENHRDKVLKDASKLRRPTLPHRP